MKLFRTAGLCSAALIAFAACTMPEENNLLVQEWTGPYGGVPPFDQVEVADFKPALEQGMALALAEITAITDDAESPTFENTIAPLERSGKALNRAIASYWVWASTMSTDEFRKVESELEPQLAAFQDQINQNAQLFARIEAVYESPEKNQLSTEQQRLVWDYYTDFVRAGARLSEADKARVAEINLRLATLYTDFSSNLLHDEESYVLYLSGDQLSGLPESFVDAAATAATERDHDGKYAITNTRSSMDPFLTYSDERRSARAGMADLLHRGDNGDEYDNNAGISEILQLRAERIKLQGV